MIVSKNWRRTLASLGLAALVIAGCGEGPLPDPHPADALHFPTHLFLSPDERTLHIVNSNFDLKYQTAAIVSIDLDTHDYDPAGYLPVPSFPGNLALVNLAEENWML